MASFASYAAALVEDLTDFRVETMVVDQLSVPRPRSRDQAVKGSAGNVIERSADRSTSIPPADPEALMDAVQAHSIWMVDAASANVTALADDVEPTRRQALLRSYMSRADQLVREPAQRRQLRADVDEDGEADPELMQRTRDALFLLGQVRAPDRAEFAPASTAGREVDHRLMRELARYWETRDRIVWCRTTMRIDGKAATQFRFTGVEAAPVNAAHRAMAMGASDQWQLLLVTLGALLDAIGGVRGVTHSLTALRWGDLVRGMSVIPPVRVPHMGLGRLLHQLIQLYSVGRVVFESPASGSGAEVRTMVLASGDIETSIRRGVSANVVMSHTDLVTRWLTELHESVRWWSQMLPALVRWACLILVVGDAGAFFKDGPSVRTFGPLVLAILFQACVAGGRRVLRRKLRQVAGHLRGEAQVLANEM